MSSTASERARSKASESDVTPGEAPKEKAIEWCLEMQRWSRDEHLSGHPMAMLGMADAVMEEALILAEDQNG